MEPLRLMTRTLLIPISRLKVVPLCASNGELVDFLKVNEIVIAAFQENVYRLYKTIPMTGALDLPGVEGSASALMAQHLEQKGIGLNSGRVFVKSDELIAYQIELNKQLRRLLSEYGLYTLADNGIEARLMDHGYVAEIKKCRGANFVQFKWFVPILDNKRKTLETLFGYALWSSVPAPKLESILPVHRTVPFDRLLTSGDKTTWDEFVKNVLAIGE
ncbi:hypothetical protein LL200_000650 [Salmonella enterica]|nr:hypothetical protein [Salmonella enterica]